MNELNIELQETSHADYIDASYIYTPYVPLVRTPVVEWNLSFPDEFFKEVDWFHEGF